MKRAITITIVALLLISVLSGIALAETSSSDKLDPASHPIFVLKAEINSFIDAALAPVLQAIESLEARIAALEAGGGSGGSVEQVVLEGAIDTTANGDVVTEYTNNSWGTFIKYHWKEVVLPPSTTTPDVKLYIQAILETTYYPENSLKQQDQRWVLQDGRVLIQYKTSVYNLSGEHQQDIVYEDQYKIVATYTPN